MKKKILLLACVAMQSVALYAMREPRYASKEDALWRKVEIKKELADLEDALDIYIKDIRKSKDRKEIEELLKLGDDAGVQIAGLINEILNLDKNYNVLDEEDSKELDDIEENSDQKIATIRGLAYNKIRKKTGKAKEKEKEKGAEEEPPVLVIHVGLEKIEVPTPSQEFRAAVKKAEEDASLDRLKELIASQKYEQELLKQGYSPEYIQEKRGEIADIPDRTGWFTKEGERPVRRLTPAEKREAFIERLAPTPGPKKIITAPSKNISDLLTDLSNKLRILKGNLVV